MLVGAEGGGGRAARLRQLEQRLVAARVIVDRRWRRCCRVVRVGLLQLLRLLQLLLLGGVGLHNGGLLGLAVVGLLHGAVLV